MPTFLVTGATGFQGGHVVDHLLAAGAKIHAVVRDQSSPKAIALKEKGVVLFQGTHEEPDEPFRAAAAGCTGLFLNPSVFEPGKARAQGDAIINACKAGAGATLTGIVLSSTSRTEVKETVGAAASVHPWLGGYYTAKLEVEAAVMESGIRDWTILRPPVLMHDLLMPHSATSHGTPQLPREGLYVTSLDKDLTMPYLDEEDVGRFAAAALLEPAKFSGRGIELGSDNLTPQEVCDIMGKVSGISVKTHKRTAAEMEVSKNTEFFQVFEKLANLLPRTIDVEALEKQYGIRQTRLVEYMEKHKELLLDSLPPRSLSAF